MARTAVEQLLYLLDQAFEGDHWHSLLANLGAVGPEDWDWVPPGGNRSIRDIIGHVGSCKLVYENYAFGDGTLRWKDLPPEGATDLIADRDSAIEWLRQAQARLRQSIAALDDAELSRPRMTNWGELKETRWIISVMIDHDLYHAGEANHLRSLRQHTDRWAHEQES